MAARTAGSSRAVGSAHGVHALRRRAALLYVASLAHAARDHAGRHRRRGAAHAREPPRCRRAQPRPTRPSASPWCACAASGAKQEKDGHIVEGIGSGVVIVDTGIILTNLHVVAGADRVEVRFHDGFESEATVIGVRPEHDLAVLKAAKIPDDLPAATLRSTADLAPGDEVVAVGYPFGIGPSVSAGVVSGLAREYRSPEGRAHPDESHPVRCGGQSGQFRRTARHHRRRSGRHRHRDPQPDRPARLHRHRIRGADRERRGRDRRLTVLRTVRDGADATTRRIRVHAGAHQAAAA